VNVRKPPRVSPEELRPFVLDAPPPHRPPDQPFTFPRCDWPTVFGNANPVELEVGCGKGLFLVTSAAERPDVNFVGVEIVRKYQLLTATRVAKRGLCNVRVACSDALVFLRECVPANSLQAVHVYFPDPWWKKRHHKRRLWTPEFAVQCSRALRAGGVLYAITDVEEYGRAIRELVDAQPALRFVTPPEPGTPAHDLDYLTNFERKFRKEGRPIFRASWEKVAAAHH
jgi:tRNA (guanine-N7-)-methyltransferase